MVITRDHDNRLEQQYRRELLRVNNNEWQNIQAPVSTISVTQPVATATISAPTISPAATTSSTIHSITSSSVPSNNNNMSENQNQQTSFGVSNNNASGSQPVHASTSASNYSGGSITDGSSNNSSPDFLGFNFNSVPFSAPFASNQQPVSNRDELFGAIGGTNPQPQQQINRNPTTDDKLDQVTVLLSRLVESMSVLMRQNNTMPAQPNVPAVTVTPPVSYSLQYRQPVSTVSQVATASASMIASTAPSVPSNQLQQAIPIITTVANSSNASGSISSSTISNSIPTSNSTVFNTSLPPPPRSNSINTNPLQPNPNAMLQNNAWPWPGYAQPPNAQWINQPFWPQAQMQPQPLRNLKPPQVRRANVELDLACLESYMNASGVVTDEQRTATLIASMDSEIRWAVQSHITNPTPGQRYDNMKRAILAHFRESEEQRLSRLIAGVKLSGRAVTMLSEMRALYNGPDNEILRRMFLDKLPPMVQMLLTGIVNTRAVGLPPMTLEELATHADIYMETLGKGNPSSINAVDYPSNQTAAVNTSDSDYELRRRIERIVRDMRSRSPSQNNKRDGYQNGDRSRQRHRSNGRDGNNNRNQQRSPTPKADVLFYKDDKDVCYFHKRWSEGAHANKKCSNWCRLNNEWRQQRKPNQEN